MSDVKRSAGYFGLNSEWAGRVAPPHPEYLISFNNGDCLIEYWKPRAEDTQEPMTEMKSMYWLRVSLNSHWVMNNEV